MIVASKVSMAGVVNTCRCLHYTTFGQGFRNSGRQFFFTMGTEIHAAEPLVSEVSAFEVEMVFEKVKGTNHRLLIKFQQN